MKRYKDWSPSAHDAKGLGIEDNHREWFVAPVILTRDSEPLDESNFYCALAILHESCDARGLAEDEREQLVEVHRFGHWACGWLEIILVNPALENECQTIERRLADYPVLSEDDFSEREERERERCWEDFIYSEFAQAIAEAWGLSDCALGVLDDRDNWDLLYYVHGQFASYSDECCQSVADGLPDRDYIAALLRAARRLKRGLDYDVRSLQWRRPSEGGGT